MTKLKLNVVKTGDNVKKTKLSKNSYDNEMMVYKKKIILHS